MKKIIKFGAFFAIFLVVLFFILNLLFPLGPIKSPKNSYILYDKSGKIIAEKLSNDDEWHFENAKIPALLKKSVLNFEDRYFYYHIGINPFSIIRATLHNSSNSNKIGASTITMQVIRLSNPQKRTYKNKIIEIFRALQLELNYTKDEILAMYFNLAPYGGNIIGAQAAARFYFDKNLDELTTSQIALLSIIPKNPNQNRLDKNRDLNSLKSRVLKSLLKDKVIDKSTYNRALSEKFSPKRYENKNHAYHYANLAFKNGVEFSNLDLNLQLQTEKILKNFMQEFSRLNINNASVLIIDNQKMQVIAYIGSHDLKSKNGYNDGVITPKSVGSTLKPFIYALALEEGLITPKQRLIDSEIYIKNYAPKNYNKKFVGEVSVLDALTLSLNTPAVFLNEKLGENSLYELLKKASLINNEKSYYGSSITLGSPDISLLDLTHLYTIFPNEGVLKPLEFAGNIIDKNTTLLRKESSYLISQILNQSPRSYLNSVWQNTVSMPIIAFKTGTAPHASNLYTIAFNKNYTIGVWLGNFDATSTNGTGAKNASVVMFEIFRFLDKKGAMNFIQKPENLLSKEICTDAFAFKECKNYEFDELIADIEPKNRCEMITNEQIHYLFESGFISLEDIQDSPCYDNFKDIKPLIAYPTDGSVIAGFDGKVALKCISFLGGDIYLNINDQKYNKVKNASEIVLDLKPGFHQIKCLDENSNLAVSNIQIKEL